ncbi:MAG: biotin--[acetyl-CoA-carboxylase] ligase [Polyangia bacterium]
MLVEDALREHRGIIGATHRALDEVGSTNDEATAWARQGAPHGAVVTAERQTKGRGRLGRAWSSPRGDNLYLSVVLRPRVLPAAAPPLTLAVGLALLDAARSCGAAAHLKWPNDLLVEDRGVRRKVAGVLTEMATSGSRIEHVVVGIGLNVGTLGFPPDLEDIATSLRLATGRALDRGEVLATLLDALDRRYADFIAHGTAATVRTWKREVDFLGRVVTVSAGSEKVTGVAEDLDDEGALLVVEENGTRHRLWAGDVTEATAR